MKNTSIILITCILLAFTSSPPGQKLSIVSNGQKYTINSDDIIRLNGSPFTFEFTVPKTNEAIVTLYASKESASYYKILKGKPVKSIKAYEPGSGMSVQVNAFMQLDSTIAIVDDAHQPFTYEGPTFSSFQAMDSTATDYIFKYHVDSLSNGQDMANDVFSIRDFPADTIYCVVTLEYKTKKKWKELGLIPFKLVLK
jgi:hypothetical protein